MSIHKLSAGSGYDYLTRQVAAHDATDKGHTGLASNYADKGETPGRWVGSGMAGIDGLDVGDEVTANQMANLFGVGHHPLAQQRWAQLEGPDVTDSELRAAMRLGAPFRIYPGNATPFPIKVATRISALSTALSAAAGGEVSLQDRARIRTEVAVEVFRATHGRDPADAREIAATIAKHTRPRTNAVSGYDLTFSPVKSVSTLWALAEPATAAAIERAHHAAVADALTFLDAVLSHLHTEPPSASAVRVTAQLADHLVALAGAGLDPATHLARALATGPLPDDHPVAALWWRIHTQLAPAEQTLITMPPHEGWPREVYGEPEPSRSRPPTADTGRVRLRAAAAHERHQPLSSFGERPPSPSR